ncbi:fibronectin type III domain-containing protein [Actinoplanes sp. URMC 104]|uniref:fibronectin type III domain-containing protein n=1 Tax=Actinoplanes sp. URMC 104 TaxID=3423409 RepID=UPI003F1CDB4C
MRIGARWLLAAWAVVVLFAVAAAAGPVASPVTAGGSGGRSAAELTALWQRYGDTSGAWLGADRTASVPLPDGRRLWLFSDTFLGRPDPDGARPRSASLVHNSAVVQDGDRLTTVHGGSPNRPESLVANDTDAQFHWIGDAAVRGDEVQVLVNRYRSTGPGPLDHALAGTELTTLSLPALAPGRLRPLPLGDKVSWGSEVMADGGHTYVYGTEAAGQMKFAHLARVRGDDLGQAWEFWTGKGWSNRVDDSARLLSGVGTTFGVRRVADRYVLVTHENNLLFSSDFVAYTAASPTGPFEGPHYLFRAPETEAGHVVYDADLHLDLTGPGALLVSYNVNDLDEAVAYADASIYRPRFFEVPWPPVAADRPPAPPGGLTAVPDGSGTARLAWKAEGGRDYRVHRRDVTAGQTHFVRLDGDAPGRFRSEFLVNGHKYEFGVTAVDRRGESAMSPVATMTATVPPPPAPTLVRAEPGDDGKVTLQWTEVPFVQLFKIYYRDLSAGQKNRSPAGAYPGQSATVGPLRHGHRYEFTVVAVGGGGDSVHSKGLRAVAVVAAPPAPGTPSAQARPDGTVQLTWPPVAPGLGYKIYQRDVSRGGADWGQPGIANTTQFRSHPLEHGHEYEFVVVAVNDGGEGARSPVVRVRARLAAPADAPTRLRATPDGAAVLLRWRSEQTWHWVFRRDVTAGESAFTREEYAVQGTRATLNNLVAGHDYELRVAAFNPGGVGPQSAPVRVRVASALPTNLTATATGPGNVRVTWRETRTDVLYRVQMRDATAGEQWSTDPLVVDGDHYDRILLTAGHRYEFRLQVNDLTTDPVSVTVR